MKNNKLKNVFLTLSIISLSMLLVIIPAIATRYTAGQGLWTSYMHEDKRIIEKDFYKSNEFEFSILRQIFYSLDYSVKNVEDSVEEYIESNTTTEWVSKINDDGEDVGYDKKIVPSKEKAKKDIKDTINFYKNELKESYKNTEFMVINTKDNSYYSNTKYKTLEEYKKNIDGYLDIEFKKTPTSNVYTKDINGKISKNMSDVEYPITGEIYSENIEMYISLPNIKDFKYNDRISEANDYYKQSIEIIETLIIIGITNLVVFIISTLIYKMIKKNVSKQESKWFKIIKKIPTEFWVLIILTEAFYYVAFSFSGYYNEYSYGYYYAGFLALAFIANLIFVITLYLSIKILCSYNKKLYILKNTIIYKLYRFTKNKIKKTLISSKRLPLIKRIILVAIICYAGSIILGLALYSLSYNEFVFIITSIICIGIFTWYIIKKLCYLSDIIEGTEKIKNGEINYKIDIKDYDNFTVLAENINNIGQGLEKSIDNQLRSERMKSELITNVSHDLKTPLTSIINYVELIKKEENIQPEYIRDYVNVLDVKSNRLKALIEDLFEASKASSGNIELNMENLEIRQLLRQSIGEMEEKLSNTNLDIKLKIPEEKMYIYADGKRMYRVFENLLSNISKYSLPNTRVYIDLEKNNENIRLTMKNISSYELNFDPNEITERFKRADESRNTEGSGLGLAIAKDLVNIQGGNFDIEIDGDLFKVSLEFKETEK